MIVRIQTATVVGVEAHPIEVECHRGRGLPGLVLIGMPRGVVREATVRVRSAILASGFSLKSHRLVINLLPAELPKETSGLDLALALAVLVSNECMPKEAVEGWMFCGELALSGRLEPGRGAVLIADKARVLGSRGAIMPMACAKTAAHVPKIPVFGAWDLKSVVAHLLGTHALAQTQAAVATEATAARAATSSGSIPQAKASSHCFSGIQGQTRAKRALEIAAAGGHNVLMVGPPGAGKTLLARALGGIMPPLSSEESIEILRIQSTSLQGEEPSHLGIRPFRAPHHSASEAALCGGGSVPRPGEITLAHRGVLFLDEFPEFPRRSLEALREPLEAGEIHICRAKMTLRFPAAFQLIAAMNPCPCGHALVHERSKPLGSKPSGTGRTQVCMCSFDKVQRYRQKISGPLLDRIDLHVVVRPVSFAQLFSQEKAEPSDAVRKRVVVASDRARGRPAGQQNARVPVDFSAYGLEQPGALRTAVERMMAQGRLSSRGMGRILRVGQTIADLAGRDTVQVEDLEEAASYRLLEGQL